MAAIAIRKRTDSETVKQDAPPRSCIICTESGDPLVRPCSCSSDYCLDCLHGMFTDATANQTRMPPSCCHLLQIHTIIRKLSQDELHAYRAKFEEWLTPVKVYCPSPTCSAFIRERSLPFAEQPPSENDLPTVLKEVFDAVYDDPAARFFRGKPGVEVLPDYTKLVKKPMHLAMIRAKLDKDEYTSLSQLSDDMRLIPKNASFYYGAVHPITRVAEELHTNYITKISRTTDRLTTTSTIAAPTFFPCPTCHIAICVKCKQIEHSATPCDLSAEDEVTAMLEQYGIKRCPRCKAGVKKMFGCPHIQCLCGAHWCHYCQKSIEKCDGFCDEAARIADEEGEEYDSELEEELAAEVEAAELATAQRVAENLASQPTSPQDTASITPATAQQETQAREGAPSITLAPAADATPTTDAAQTTDTTPNPSVPQSAPTNNPPATLAPANSSPTVDRIVDLDRGGGARWGDGGYDFGEEPETDGSGQVWSCTHYFQPCKPPPDDGFDHGDFTRMECNRCFEHVEMPKEPVKPAAAKKRRKLASFIDRASPKTKDEGKEEIPPLESPAYENEASECHNCKLIVCAACKEKYAKEQKEEEEE